MSGGATFNAAQGELAEEVDAQRPVRLGGLVERERAGDMDLERPESIRRLSLSVASWPGITS